MTPPPVCHGFCLSPASPTPPPMKLATRKADVVTKQYGLTYFFFLNVHTLGLFSLSDDKTQFAALLGCLWLVNSAFLRFSHPFLQL